MRKVWPARELGLSRESISSAALKTCEGLREGGYQAFVVGGGVRDSLLALKPKDFDVATNARPEEVQKLFRRSRIIGRRFQIVHVMFGREVIETSTFRALQADAQTDADLWVMAPMVADAHEAAYFVKLGKSFGLKKVGVMAEVPSIALMADQVAKVADFVSIGTNDLTQYTLAADRTLGSVANYQTAWHPAVLRAIKLIADAGNANGMPVGVCGEAAADPDLAVVLTGIGVNSLSMTPVALDDVRAELAGVTLEEAQEKAAKALNGDFYNPSEWNI